MGAGIVRIVFCDVDPILGGIPGNSNHILLETSGFTLPTALFCMFLTADQFKAVLQHLQSTILVQREANYGEQNLENAGTDL
jgi:hypothetical protein